MVTFYAPTSDTESYISAEDNAVIMLPPMDIEGTPTYADLARTIELMQTRINQLESAQEHRSPPPVPPAPPSPQIRRPRPTQGDPEPYDHTKPELFPQFESKLQAKLIIDAAAIGGPYEQLWYGCLWPAKG